MIEFVSEVGVELVEASASDNMVAMAAWVSHDADSEKRLEDQEGLAKLIDFLYRNKHLSPFEHGHFTFKVDVPLFVAREFMRHRTASYNEVSGRYTLMKPRFYVGSTARVQKGKPGDYFFEDADEDQTAVYLTSKRKAAKKAWKEYERRLEAGIAKEQAREDLPLSLMTQFYVTMNPRNLMQFLTLRNEKHALKEIRDVAVEMEKIFSQKMPLTYKAYVKQRDKEEVDVEDLKTRLRNTEWKVQYADQKVDYFNTQLLSLKKAKADIEARYNETVKQYNGLYVHMQEENPYTKQYTVDLEAKNKELEEEIADLKQSLTELKPETPVYNVIVTNSENLSAEEISRLVDETQSRRSR